MRIFKRIFPACMNICDRISMQISNSKDLIEGNMNRILQPLLALLANHNSNMHYLSASSFAQSQNFGLYTC